ncbi:MAG: hypothetical protein WCV99_02655 [Sterolibacterium sp.]|jgi:hypothetical protein
MSEQRSNHHDPGARRRAAPVTSTFGITSRCATAGDALAFVREHGVVLVSARGSAPRLTEAIVGEAIKGSWWAHPQSRHIYAILQAVTESGQVLVCRLIDGKLTLVHHRLWPALARLADRFAPERLAQITQEHTASGSHVNREVPFPQWVPPDVFEQAEAIGDKEALAAFAPWLAPAQLEFRRLRTKS